MKEQFRGHRAEKCSKVNTPFNHIVRACLRLLVHMRQSAIGVGEMPASRIISLFAPMSREARGRRDLMTRAPNALIHTLLQHIFAAHRLMRFDRRFCASLSLNVWLLAFGPWSMPGNAGPMLVSTTRYPRHRLDTRKRSRAYPREAAHLRCWQSKRGKDAGAL